MPRSFVRRRRPIPRWKRRLMLWMSILFICVILAYTVLSIVERNVEPVLRTYAYTRVKQVATDSVREALREQIVSQKAFEDVIKFVRDDQGQVQGVVIDEYKQTRLHEEALSHIQNYLTDHMQERMREQELDTMDIYLGQMFNSRIFADAGPSIPVSFVPKGAVEIDVEPTIESAGINNILVNLMLDIKLDVSVVIPFPTDPVSVTTRYPLATAVVVGDTPEWYWNTTGSGSDMPTIPGITPGSTPDGPKVEGEGS